MTRYQVAVKGSWLPSQEFFVSQKPSSEMGLLSYSEKIDILPYRENFKLRLLANHKSSFYGTFATYTAKNDREGFCLKGLQALEFFGNLPESAFIAWEWSEEIKEAEKMANSIEVLLKEGSLMPDYEQFLLGIGGWKPQKDKDFGFENIQYRIWLSQCVDQLVASGQHSDNMNWQNIREIHPRLFEERMTSKVYFDEEHWLMSLGWDNRELPFKMALQLVEPEIEDYWTLKIVLQDKENPYYLIEVDPSQGLGDLALPEGWSKGMEGLGREVRRWTKFWPPILSEDEPLELKSLLEEEEAWDFLNEGSVALTDGGVTVWLPEWWQEMLSLKPKVKIRAKGPKTSSRKSLVGFDQLIDFDWRLAMGDMEITPEEFAAYANEKKRFMKIKDRWVQIDPQILRELRKLIKGKEEGITFQELLYEHLQRGALSESPLDSDPFEVEYEVGNLYKEVFNKLLGEEGIPAKPIPSDFQGQLRGYQQAGFNWLLYLRSLGLGACLADDMGLGKTVQWIAYLLAARAEAGEKAPALLICPTSVIGNWQKELARFAPTLKVYIHYGPTRSKGEEFNTAIRDYDLVITSYSLANLDQGDLEQIKWENLCLDEAQNIKNIYTKQAKAIRSLKAKHKVVLTGTPMENRLIELWSIIDFINPGYLGPLKAFQREMVAKIEREKDEKYISLLQRLVKPFILRRLKKDPAIELDLPEKEEIKEYVKLTMEQASLYEYVIEEMFKTIEKTEAMERRGLILKSLMKLKQICDHPALLLKEEVTRYQEERSNKLDRLLEMVQQVRAKGQSCLIFTQFLGMGHLIKESINKELGEKVYFLNGGTSKIERDRMVSTFQDPDIPEKDRVGIFILSLKAGGVGLNLTAANVVFHFDRWWNPAVENQATDRAYRIGQDKDVEVYKFLTLGTLEEKIDEIIEQKQGLNDMIVGTGEGWVTELSTEELRDIFALRRQWLS